MSSVFIVFFMLWWNWYRS